VPLFASIVPFGSPIVPLCGKGFRKGTVGVLKSTVGVCKGTVGV
jgi:hypothetical protein